jgi:uncharacterized glyoxalase superfamily protein PhnB
MNSFEGIVPILNVKDFAATMEYYEKKLGFKKKWDWGEPPVFGCVTRGDVNIFFCQGAQGQAGMWMSIFTEDVDALHQEYKVSGATIRMPPTNMPWGTREMNVEDLDGHRFRMGSHSTGAVEPDATQRFSEMEAITPRKL